MARRSGALSAVVSLGKVGDTPGDTLHGGDRHPNRIYFFVAEFSGFCLNSAPKNNFSRVPPHGGCPQGGKETTGNKGRQFCGRKNRVTPSVAAPGDTIPSDTTDCLIPRAGVVA